MFIFISDLELIVWLGDDGKFSFWFVDDEMIVDEKEPFCWKEDRFAERL